jgi:hypothetical protein
MTRILATGALAVALLAGSAGAASASIGNLGGQCDGAVDVGCREHACQPDELDCGLVPPCSVWTAATRCLI